MTLSQTTSLVSPSRQRTRSRPCIGHVIWIRTLLALRQRLHHWQSVTTSKTLSDFIKPFIEHVKSGMKALVVKVKYVADYDKAKKPVVTIQVAKNLVGRPAGEDNEFPQRTHLNRPRVAFELFIVHEHLWRCLEAKCPPARRRAFGERISHRSRCDGCASRSELGLAA
jgi:hypothetical protein